MINSKYKDINSLLNELKIQDAPKSWYDNWGISMSQYPGEDIFFLSDDYLSKANRILNLKSKKLEPFCKTLALIRGSVALCHLTWLWYHIIYFSSQESNEIDLSVWPVPVSLLEDCSDMLHAVVLIAGLPLLQKFYEARNISGEVLVETLSDLGICMEEYLKRFGVYGIGLFRMEWLLNHFTGKLFRLGRLQFVYKEFNEYFKVYQNIRSGEYSAICGTGVEFDTNGDLNGSNGVFYDNGIWKSEYSEDEAFVYGNPILPSGRPLKEKASLAKAEWGVVLTEGDGLLDVHIPRGEPLEYDSCQQSYDAAVKFFSVHFPELEIKGFTCCSWLLSSRLRLLLPEDSNIIRFQNDYYLYPTWGDDSVYEYVFGHKPDDLSKLPERTSLQRAVKNHILNGNSLTSNAGVFLRRESR